MATYDFTLAADAASGDTVKTVAEYGLAHLPGFLDAATTAEVARQCRELLDAEESWVTPLDYSIGKSVRFERAAAAADPRFAGVAAAYSTDFMRDVADGLFAGVEYLFNYDLYIAYDVEGSDHFAHSLHYDRMPHLKFFLYLSDVTARTGPLFVVPGSHRHAPVAQAENRSNGVIPAEAETRLIPDEYRGGGEHLQGPAGTLIVFNSDLIHSATHIEAGDRLVIRSRCIEPRYLEAARRQAAAAAAGQS